MNDDFYNSPYRIYSLISEMNRITNEEIDYEEIAKQAPFIYTHGKCYYFARGLHDVIPNSTLYSTIGGDHIVVKIGKFFYDANGVIWEREDIENIDPRPYDLNNAEDIYSLHTLVANDYDDEYLLPVVIEIAKRADNNLKESISLENSRKRS